MNDHQIHDSLVSEYHESARVIQRFRMHAFIFHASIWAALFLLKNLGIQEANLMAVFLFGIFFFSRVWSFTSRRNLDIRTTQITLEGLKLEMRNPRLENFFQGVLKQFGLIRIFLLRAMFDFMALFCFTTAVYRLALDYNPDLALNIRTFYPALGLMGFFIGDLYYKPFEALLKAKKTAFSN